LKPEGKLGLHSIDSLRQFCEEVYLYPYEAKKKVFILHDADRMAPAGANALLKTFEEPAPDALIILVSSHPAALLDTILSRCLKVYFRAVSETDIHALLSQRNVTDAQARLFSRLAGGSVRQALQWAEEGLDPGRATLLEALGRGALASYTDVVALSAGLADALDKRRKNLEGEWRRELLAAYPDPKAVTALQRHAMEKEVEGALATHYAGEVQQLLDVLLSWYRDLTYLKEGGTVEGVLNLDCADALKRWVDKGWPVHGLEEVQAAVADLQRALARSSPLAPQLEGLFLRLGLC
jgi:DNA polymerase-3 subunit delta'